MNTFSFKKSLPFYSNSRNSILGVSAFLSFVFLLFVSHTAVAQPSTQEQLAVQYYQQGDFDKAVDLFAQLYKSNQTHYFYNYYFNTLIALNDFKKLDAFVKSVANKNPSEIKYKVDLAYVAKMAGDTKKAEKMIDKLRKDLPNSRAEFVSFSNALSVRDFYKQAISVLESGKFDPPLNIELADLYFAKGDYNNMISSYLSLVHNQDQYIDLVKGKFQIIMSDYGSDKISQALRYELLQRTEKFPNKTIYAELLYWYSVQKREYGLALIQAKALDRQFAENGERVFQLANILVANKEFAKASDGYSYILSLGANNRFYQLAEINLLHARFKSISAASKPDLNGLQSLESDYLSIIKKYGENRTTLDLIRNLAQIQAFWLHNTQNAELLLERAIEIVGLSREEIALLKMELADVLLFEGKKWSASLLYKQVEKDFKNDPIGFEAKFKAAKFFYFVGEMEWAKIQLDVLKGATSKLIANDAMELSLLIAENIDEDSSYTSLSYYARADLLAWQQKFQEAFLVLDTIERIFPGYPILPNVSYKRAEIFQLSQNYDSAVYFFSKVIEMYPYSSIADNALFNLAKIYDNLLVNKEKARDSYEKMILDYPGSLFTVESRKRFNELRNQSN